MKENQSKRHDDKTEDEDAFSLIEKGNALQSAFNRWGSSDYYSRASSTLRQMSSLGLSELRYSTISTLAGQIAEEEEEAQVHVVPVVKQHPKNKNDAHVLRKINALYHDQSVEYLHKARQSLIGAMMFEREEDMKQWADNEPMVEAFSELSDSSEFDQIKPFDPFMVMLTPEQRNRRMKTFERLFVSQQNGLEEEMHDHGNDSRICKICRKVEEDIVIMENELKIESDLDINAQHELLQEKEDIVMENNDDSSIQENEIDSLQERLSKLAPIVGDQSLLNEDERDVQAESKSTTTDDNDDDDDNDDNNRDRDNVELTLEERLMRLENSLPSSMKPKTDKERIENIKSGLGDLGVFIPSQNNKQSIDDDNILSEDEQIKEIMDMARDEVELNKKYAGESDGGEDSHDNDVEEILRKSGIRINLPLDGEEEFGNDQQNLKKMEGEFWSSMNNLADSADTDLLHDEDGREMQQLKQSLAKAQQLLLQASICLEENDDASASETERETEIHHDDEGQVDNEIDNKDGESKRSKSTKQERILGMGRNSLLEAQVLMEQLIKAWPKSNVEKSEGNDSWNDH
mmetsp:Transcript_20528/g.23248  ORF Transcript_20528/g.23248 Transcript_20528/m.23248 type:complete len:575 (-) Transcript_20528:37-1761(-)